MCNLSLGLRMEAMQEGLAKGLAEGELKSTIQYVKNMMKKMPEMSIEEAMDILGVEENLREQVVEALQ